ncbi:MAG: SDR family NAD(P)-dependent oxidoreductase [Actinobacteria bacterium]|nr:SDR family NAD(P)-dependent oxidoreductase [Actinomycetota bacterium]MCB9411480.1 SDR family NAD(P)-dependent oxidoreductase [Actinomycetota bacterium]
MNNTPVVVVLGAGIGGVGVVRAVAADSHLVVVDRTEAAAEAAAALAVELGGTSEGTVLDLTDLAAVEAWRDELLGRLGRVDAVVHLVGGWQGSEGVDETAIAQWNTLLPGIVTTVQTTSVAFGAALRAAPRGRYVMVTSTSVPHPKKGNAAYASAKAAAETWVKALGDSFEGSGAAACIVAVTALVDPAVRAAHPERAYTGFTDTTDLGEAIAGLFATAGIAPVTYLDLTMEAERDGD